MTEALDALADDAIALADRRRRAVLGIAGSPGAGKSTLVESWPARIARAMRSELGGARPDGRLPPGRRATRPPRRAWAQGRARHVRRRGLRPPAATGCDAETDAPVYVPGFDRQLEQPLAAALVVLPEARLVITEGNYLLLDEPAWAYGPARRWTACGPSTGAEELRIDGWWPGTWSSARAPARRGTGWRAATRPTPTSSRRRSCAADRLIVNGPDGWYPRAADYDGRVPRGHG